jgi:hypothetical protein
MDAPALTPAERKKREEAVNYARASVLLEGFKLSPADEERGRRFINGEISMAEFVKVRRGPADKQ